MTIKRTNRFAISKWLAVMASRMMTCFLLMSACSIGLMANDILISLKGDILEGKIDHVTQDKVYVIPRLDNKVMNLMVKTAKMALPVSLKKVYMIRKEKGMTTFVHQDGSTDSVQSQKWDKSADRIYLMEGNEIQCWNAKIGDNAATYLISNPSKVRLQTEESIPLADIFMIWHKDGTKEIINEFEIKEEYMSDDFDYAAFEEECDKKAWANVYELPEAMTIGDIARKHGVSAEDICRWNNCPDRYNAATILKAGSTVWVAPH